MVYYYESGQPPEIANIYLVQYGGVSFMGGLVLFFWVYNIYLYYYSYYYYKYCFGFIILYSYAVMGILLVFWHKFGKPSHDWYWYGILYYKVYTKYKVYNTLLILLLIYLRFIIFRGVTKSLLIMEGTYYCRGHIL